MQNLKGDIEALKYFGLTKTPWHKELEVPYRDTENVLSALKERGYNIGIIANQSVGTAERLEKWGLLKYINVVLSSAEEGISKPDSEIFLRALQHASCSADEAFMIGDRLDNDIYPALKLGFKTIWVRQGFSSYQHLKENKVKPDFIVNNLTEILDIL